MASIARDSHRLARRRRPRKKLFFFVECHGACVPGFFWAPMNRMNTPLQAFPQKVSISVFKTTSCGGCSRIISRIMSGSCSTSVNPRFRLNNFSRNTRRNARRCPTKLSLQLPYVLAASAKRWRLADFWSWNGYEAERPSSGCLAQKSREAESGPC